MYNGIGLTTPRGSGTNGYVQRNIAHMIKKRDKDSYKSEEDIERMTTLLTKGPNPEILEHQRLRQVEVKPALPWEERRKGRGREVQVKCMELEELMEEQNYGREEIEGKVAEYRELLRGQLETVEKKPVSQWFDEAGRQIASETHQVHSHFPPPSCCGPRQWSRDSILAVCQVLLSWEGHRNEWI